MAEARDPLRYFRIEARELVDQISAGVLDLEQQPGPGLVAKLLRYAHTLKGAARVVRQPEIADRAHAFEEVLVPHRDGGAALPGDEMRELLRLNDEISGFVSALEPAAPAASGPDAPGPAASGPAASGPAASGPAASAEAVPAAPASAAPAEPAPTEPASAGPAPAAAFTPAPVEAAGALADEPAPRAVTADLDELLDAIGEASARVAPLREGSRTLTRLHRTVETLGERVRSGRTTGTRVTVQRLAAELSALDRRLVDAVDQVQRELDEVRGRAEGLRLVPAGTIFTSLHRAVRDAADAEGKRVRFVGRGAEVRMSPYLLNQLNSAFLHVVRNAVVHGIEAAGARAAAGKPEEGTIVVEVERRGRYAHFRCVDDGRGFDLPALRRNATARGQSVRDDEALLDLVLRGGMSTSAAVTEVAGRGIGMDVARDVAVQLRGEVSIRSRPGAGATVELIVPLTLLSMNGLLVEAGATVATMPLEAVRRCVRLPDGSAAAAAATGRFTHDGEVVPFLPLARALGLPDGGHPGVAVVLGADTGAVAIGVDRLAGTTTLVARPLPDLAPAAPVIGSVSIDVDGNPRLVLDAHGLIAEARRDRSSASAAPTPAAPVLPVLIVDDSLTTRMLERSILESAGYEVDLAASGEEGLEKARGRRYGLFLSDIDMPGIDGFTFVAETRADPALNHIPAILVSSRASAEDRRRGTEVGASAYVVKGEFDQEELLAHIRRLILR